MKQERAFLRILIGIILCSGWGFAQTNLLTANYGNERANANLQESRLSTDSISSTNFGKLGFFAVDGQVYTQPLFVSALAMPGKGTRDVVFVTTMHNSVYAFDAAAPSFAPLWQVNLGPSVPSSFLNVKDVTPEIGILSTGVIDLTQAALYVMAVTFEGGACVYRLHALDLATGQEKLNGPAVIAGAVTGTGDGSEEGIVAFEPNQHLQRPGLLLLNGAVYASFGSHQDQWPFHGWMVGYDASNLHRQTGLFVTTPNASGGSIWQSGRGPAADNAGNIYVITGNGDYDGQPNFGETFLKVSPGLSVLDWFTPSNWRMLTDGDYDLSAGPALIPGTHLVVGGNKYGTLYLINGDAMGRLGADATPSVQSFQAVEWGGIFNFAIWSRTDGAYVYLQEQGSPLLSYRVVNGRFETTPNSVSTVVADIPYDGITVSANGSQDGSGIVWETTGDHRTAGVPGTLHAFDALDLTNELWNSDMNSQRDSLGAFAKFVSPTVGNGRVYVPTFSNRVVVYGLLPGGGNGDAGPVVTSAVNGASSMQGPIAPGEVLTVFGANFGPSDTTGMQIDSSGQVASELAGMRVLFDGNPSPLLSAAPNQATVVVPFGLAPGTSQLQVEYEGQPSDPFPLTVAPATPGVYSMDGSGTGQGLIVNADGTANSADNPAPTGSVVLLYATGTGLTAPAWQDGQVVSDSSAQPVLPISVEINGQAADLLYAGGAPGFVAGIMQINARVPEGATGPAISVVLKAGNLTSQFGITMAVE